ncbi:hypothetical protein SELMODRAFT_422359 [Selaginella moellendorffii]|uniref:Uncharacterized protein n=1 Tax=Selaginella moellendorffii TaxID=88036 RepID=D8SI57_SELML|nr:hypothetical protein SELMODRAFT_422359 [Selaginella moellendorffii]
MGIVRVLRDDGTEIFKIDTNHASYIFDFLEDHGMKKSSYDLVRKDGTHVTRSCDSGDVYLVPKLSLACQAGNAAACVAEITSCAKKMDKSDGCHWPAQEGMGLVRLMRDDGTEIAKMEAYSTSCIIGFLEDHGMKNVKSCYDLVRKDGTHVLSGCSSGDVYLVPKLSLACQAGNTAACVAEITSCVKKMESWVKSMAANR